MVLGEGFIVRENNVWIYVFIFCCKFVLFVFVMYDISMGKRVVEDYDFF